MSTVPPRHASKLGYLIVGGLPLSFAVASSCVPDFNRRPANGSEAGASGGEDATGGGNAPGGSDDRGGGGGTSGGALGGASGGGTGGSDEGGGGGEAGDAGGSGTGGSATGGNSGAGNGGSQVGAGAGSQMAGNSGLTGGGIGGVSGAAGKGGAAGNAGAAAGTAAGTGGAGGGSGAGGSPSGAGGVGGAGGSGGNCDTGTVMSWEEQFDGTSIGSSWTLWEFSGTRRNGQAAELGRISLTASPGNLRFFVDPMLIPGFRDDYGGYQPTQNTYWYDPSVEVHRAIAGRRWIVETKVNWYVPVVVNAAGFFIAVDFGRVAPPQAEEFSCLFYRFSNESRNLGVPTEYNRFGATCGVEDWTAMAELVPNIVRYVRFERADTTLTVRFSSDGAAWTNVASSEIPEGVRCTTQRVLLSTHSWFSPGGAYADYDYIRFERQD